MQVRDQNGVSILLETRWGNLESGVRKQVRHVWRLDEPGTYELRSFLISPSCNPEVLAPVGVNLLRVEAPGIDEKVVPRWEYLTQEERKKLTRDEIEAFELEEFRRDEIEAEAFDAYIERVEEKERRIRDLIWTDERIMGYQQTVLIFGFDSDFTMDESYCDNAEMTILLTRGRHVEGHWESAYIVTFSGRSELKVSVVDAKIVSIIENPLNDTTSEHVYNEEEKMAIRIAIADGGVQALFRDTEMEIGVVRSSKVSFSGCNDMCAIVVIYAKYDREKVVVIRVDVSNQTVTSVS